MCTRWFALAMVLSSLGSASPEIRAADWPMFGRDHTRNSAIAGKDQPPKKVGHWPQWRGPGRTNVATETGLLKSWPPQGPPLLWKVNGLGLGVPSVAVAGGRIF